MLLSLATMVASAIMQQASAQAIGQADRVNQHQRDEYKQAKCRTEGAFPRYGYADIWSICDTMTLTLFVRVNAFQQLFQQDWPGVDLYAEQGVRLFAEIDPFVKAGLPLKLIYSEIEIPIRSD
jgi:hypothetical protein